MKYSSGIKALLVLAALCWLGGTQSVTAQTLLLKFSDPALKGESVIDGHTDEISVNSFSAGEAIGVGSAVSGNRQITSPSFSEITIQKSVDRSSPSLSLYCATGNHNIGSATLYVLQSSGGPLKENYRIELTEPIISSDTISGSSGGGQATEFITLNFTKIRWIFTPLSGANTDPISTGYDLTTQTQL